MKRISIGLAALASASLLAACGGGGGEALEGLRAKGYEVDPSG